MSNKNDDKSKQHKDSKKSEKKDFSREPIENPVRPLPEPEKNKDRDRDPPKKE